MAQSSSFLKFAAGMKRGDGEAADKLVRRFATRMTILARKRLPEILKSKVAAEDVVQSAFRSFFGRQAKGDVEYKNWESLWALLAMIVVRKCNRQIERYTAQQRAVNREEPLSGLKTNRPSGRRPIAGSELRPEDEAVQRETLEQLLGSFDGRDQQIVERLLSGKLNQAIAAELGCSRRTVERTAARMHVRLERMLESLE